MLLKLKRLSSTEDDTLGCIFHDRSLECFTLEDEYREVKVLGETRIKAGRYQIFLREEGGMYEKYSKKYSWHEGMLHLQDVPDFKYIYIHPGNDDDDTDGCILVGDCMYTNVVKNGALGRSMIAYERLYKKVLNALIGGEKVFIDIR